MGREEPDTDVDHGQRDLIHVKVALENSLLKGVRLLGFPGPGRLSRGRWHFRDRLGPVMARAGGRGRSCRSRRRVVDARAEGERGPRARGYGAFGAGPKLIGPVEALV